MYICFLSRDQYFYAMAHKSFQVDKVERATKLLQLSTVDEAVKGRLKIQCEVTFSTSRKIVNIAKFDNRFLATVHAAYSEYYPLVLTPDVIWMCIAQGFAKHVNCNAEKLRHLFVQHKDKKELHTRTKCNTPVQYIQHTSLVHATHQSSTCNTPVQYIQHTSPVHATHQSSTCNTPVQYMQHTSPVHTTHQSSTCNTPVQYMQHTSPIHATHQSSTYNTPVQYMHQSSTYNTPVQYIQHTSPVHTTHQSSTYNTPVQYIQHTSLVHTTHQSSTCNTPV